MHTKIEIERQERGFFVRVGDRFAEGLCRDEALGVVAAVLYGSDLPYLKTYAQSVHWGKIYCGWKDPVGALPQSVEPMGRSEFFIYRREVLADVKNA